MTELRVLVGTAYFERSNDFYADLLRLAVAERSDAPDGRRVLFRAASGGVSRLPEER